MELCLLNSLILIDCFFCVILTFVCSLRACHMWLTRNHLLCFEEAVNKYLDTVDKGVSSLKHIANQTRDRFNLHNFMLRLFSLHIRHTKICFIFHRFVAVFLVTQNCNYDLIFERLFGMKIATNHHSEKEHFITFIFNANEIFV